MGGLYNMVFGTNDLAVILLSALGFKKTDVGRFRDAVISEGTIAVYTRNGGGNRFCWHVDNPTSGNEACKHHVVGSSPDEEFYCEEPGTAACACPGCIINFRLPQHPLYIRDVDDSFDDTYATIFFKFPPELEEQLKKLDSGEKFDPDKRWLSAIDAIKKTT
jgi:hypothetical protein